LVWTIEYLTSVKKELRKLDRQVARRIVDFMDNRIAGLENPRNVGLALSGQYEGLWRYRVGDSRILCDTRDDKLVVLVVAIGHRIEVYR
jgi:mRNA interferase RelE/StbE